MSRRKFELGSVFMLVTLLVFGCASVNYIGNTDAPTTSVDLYFSAEAITQEYTVLGHAIGSIPMESPDSEEIRAKLIEVAMLKGADAILITGMGRDKGGVAGSIENHVNALFLKYK